MKSFLLSGAYGTRAPVLLPHLEALPVASLENLTLQPDWAAYVANVRNGAAGVSYTDPMTGVRVVKVSSATSPASNAGVTMHYSMGGPFTSQPLDASGTISASVPGWIFDIAPGGVPTNWRQLSPTISELRFAFSRNPATPHLAYVIDVSSVLHRVNHVTGAPVTGNGFPYDLSEYNPTNRPAWLSVARGDAALVCLANYATTAQTVVHVTPLTEAVAVKSEAAVLAAIGDATDGVNECYVSEDGRFVYIPLNNPESGSCIWDTVTGFISARGNAESTGFQASHTTWAGPRAFVSSNPSGSRQTTVRREVSEVTANGAAYPATTLLQEQSLTSIGLGHNSSVWPGDEVGRHRWTIGTIYPGIATNVNTPARLGAWSLESGEIYKAVHTGDLGYGAALRGVASVLRRADATAGAAIVATLPRAASVGAMVEGSWFYDLSTRTVYLWAVGGGEPDSRYVMIAPTVPFHSAIAALRLDGGDQRIIAAHHIYGLTTAGSLAYYAQGHAHQSQDGRWVMWSTDHGVPDGRTDVMIAQLPVS